MAEGEAPRRPTPDYQDDPDDPDNYVRLRLDIPGLKKKTLMKRTNATVTLEAKELTLKVKIDLQVGATTKKYEYNVKQLPDPILTGPNETFWKIIRDEEVVVMLRKATPRKWNNQLQAKGLDVSSHT